MFSYSVLVESRLFRKGERREPSAVYPSCEGNQFWPGDVFTSALVVIVKEMLLEISF